MPSKLISRYPWLLRYAAALAAVDAGWLVRLGLTGLVGPGLPTYVTFYPAVMIVALLAGFGPGIVATAVSALLVDFWLLSPQGSLAVANAADGVGLALFAGNGVFFSVVSHLFRRARERAAAYDTEVQERESKGRPAEFAGQALLLNAGLIVSLAILALADWQCLRYMGAEAEADHLTIHAYTALEESEQLLSALTDAETEQRGYLLTGDERYLDPYKVALSSVETSLASMKRLGLDDPGQRQRVAVLQPLIRDKLAELKETVEMRRTNGLEAALQLVATGRGKILMDEIRQGLGEAQEKEEGLLHAQSAAKAADSRKTLQALLAGGIFSFLVLAAVFLFLKRENAGRRRAETALLRHRDQLQDAVAARTAELSQANQALGQQREWLHVTLDSIGDAVVAADTDGRITFLNPVAESLTGYPELEALGQPVQSVFRTINEETRAPGEDIFARVVSDGRVLALANHTALVARDGREIPVEDSAAPIKDSAGKISGVVVVFHDVTLKRRAQAAMRASQRQSEFLANILEGASQPFAIGYPDGRMGLLNRAFEELTGYTAEELRSLDWVTKLTPPEWRELDHQKLEELQRTGQPVRYEKEYLRKDGRRVPIELLVHLARDAQGKPDYYYSFLTDITARKQAEEAVRRLNAELRQRVGELETANEVVRASRKAALNLMDDALQARKQVEQATAELRNTSEQRRLALEAADLGAWDYHFQTGDVTWDKRCREMWGVPESDHVDYSAAINQIHPDDRKGVDAAVQEALAGHNDGAYHCEFRVVWPDGSVHWIASHGHVYFQGEGGQRRPIRFTGANQDITQRKQREEQLQNLNRTLTALKDSSQAMLRASSEAEYLSEVCKIIVEDCGHAMVWVGLAEEDRARTVRPVAHAGFEEGYLETLGVTWDDTERGRGPTGTAIRTGIPCACKNMLTDPRLAPWRPEALKRGYASSLVIPLRAGAKPFGAITIYSKLPDPFSEDEVKLLVQLADDVSYCVGALRLRVAKAQADLERERAQAALQKANEELEQRVADRTAELHAASRYARSLIEASLDPLITISPDGKITDVNEATELVTGVARNRLIGSDFSRFFTEPARAEAGYHRVLAEGLVRDYPLTIRHTSGQTTEVLYHATVYHDETGQVQGVFAAARDITERLHAERRREFTSALLALFAQKRAAPEYLHSVLEVVRQWSGCQALGIRITDEHGEIPYQTWSGFEPEFIELENRLSLQRDNCCCIRAISQAFEKPDRSLLTPGGSYRCDDAIAFVNKLPPAERARYRGNCMKFGFASLAIVPIRYRNEVIGAIHLADRRPDQFPLAAVEFLETMTPLVGEALHRFKMEAELARHRDQLEVLVRQRTQELTATNARLLEAAEDLERSNRDLEQFAYVASHDLQEPLRAVGGYVKLIERRLSGTLDARVREFIAGAFEGALRMERLISDLLAFSRVGTRGGDFVATDFDTALQQALRNLEASIESAPATVTHDPLPTLTVDATQIMQLFQNLLGNALKFRAEAPLRVHVGAQKQDGRWVFSVRDNGIGIEPQYFEKIFQIFQRLHTRKQYSGTGIGLAICKKIVERHGGTIWVESQPGQGSTFYFSLPEADAKDQERG